MKKIVFIALSAAALCIGAACERIDDLEQRVVDLESSVSALKSVVDAGAVVTSITEEDWGYGLTLSNGKTYSVKNGKDGQPGKDGKDGEDGQDGQDGQPGKDGKDGDSFFASVTVAEDGRSLTLAFADGSSVIIPIYNDSAVSLIKSVNFIPEYTDGCATIKTGRYDGLVEASYDIRPLVVAEAVAAHPEFFTIATTALKTRSDAASVVSVKYEAGKVTVKALAPSLVGAKGAFSLVIADSDSQIASAYTQVVEVEVPYLEYAGQKYLTVTLKDGNVWMAENLRYVPEGKTVAAVSDDYTGTTNDGIFYPCKLVVANGVATATPSSDADIVEAQGLLYTAAAVFGTTLPTTDWVDLENNQGICPSGWHIPTAQEWVDLVGGCSASDHKNTSAVYYEDSLAGASLEVLCADGFNLLPYPYVNQGKKYVTTYSNRRNGSIFSTYGSISYYHASTGRSATQSYAAMITNNNTKSSVNVAYNTLTNAIAVRCVKNK